MSDLITALKKQFGESKVSVLNSSDNQYIDLIKIDLEMKTAKCIIMTNGLSNYEMPVPDQFKGKEFNEIYFCLPNYWDIEDAENPNMNWPFEFIQKLAKNVIENKTWYAPGHTIANGKPPQPISNNMKEEYFILTTPILMEDFLRPLQIGEKKTSFLAVIPIFKNEYELKTSMGYKKWIVNYRMKNGTEVLDDFRMPIKASLLSRIIRKRN